MKLWKICYILHDMIDKDHSEFERYVFAEDYESAKKEILKKDLLEGVVKDEYTHLPSHIFDDKKSTTIEKTVEGYNIVKEEWGSLKKLWKVKYELRYIFNLIDKKEMYEEYVAAFSEEEAKKVIEKINSKKGIIDPHTKLPRHEFLSCELIDVKDICLRLTSEK